MRKSSGRVVAAAALGLALASAGCGGDDSFSGISYGAVLSVTGDLANIGNEQLQAAQLAAEEINAKGGVLGKKIRIVNKDDSTMEDRGKLQAEALAATGVPVIIGAVGSAISLKVSEATTMAGIVQISASSTSPLLSAAADNNYLFRTCPSDALQGKLVAKRAKAKNFTKVAVVHIKGAYGEGLAGAFETEFVAGGGTVTSKTEYLDAQTSYSAMLTTIYQGAPEAIVLVAYPVDGAQIVKDYLSAFSARNTFWFFTDALQDTGFVAGVGGTNFSFQHEATGPATPTGTAYDTFKAAFKARYGRDPSAGTFSPHAYDAVYVTALATEAAGMPVGSLIRDKMSGVSTVGTKFTPDKYAEAVAAIKAGTDIDFDGVSGAIDFDAKGDTVAPYDVWKVTNGVITTVDPSVNP